MDSETTDSDLFADGTVNLKGLKSEYGIPRSTAYELMNSGRLPFTRPFGRRLIPRAAVKKLMSEGLVGSEK